MFNLLVAVEPVNLSADARGHLGEYARKTVFYDSSPEDDDELIARIGDADAVLVSYTTVIDAAVLRATHNLRYVGMCCSLYSEESANVDIAAAQELGIAVTGVRDYGDAGVVEFVIGELARYLHGFGGAQWRPGEQHEIASLCCGIIGMGATGTLIAQALQFFGASVCYYSRTRKPDLEACGFSYRPLAELLAASDAVFTCLNKGVELLGEREFQLLGRGKIVFNTSIAPGHDADALERWLDAGAQAESAGGYPNAFFCDTEGALGNPVQAARLLSSPYVHCMQKSSGSTAEAKVRLGEKVLENIAAYLARSE